MPRLSSSSSPPSLELRGVFVPLGTDNVNVIIEHGLGESERSDVFGSRVHASPWPVDHEESARCPSRVSLSRALNSGPAAHRATILAHALTTGEALHRIPRVRLHRLFFFQYRPTKRLRSRPHFVPGLWSLHRMRNACPTSCGTHLASTGSHPGSSSALLLAPLTTSHGTAPLLSFNVLSICPIHD
jgi:hypothetical protein